MTPKYSTHCDNPYHAGIPACQTVTVVCTRGHRTQITACALCMDVYRDGDTLCRLCLVNDVAATQLLVQTP